MARLDRANKAGMNRLPQHAQPVTISSPVGTVTTFQFNPSGTIEDWTVPFHDGPMKVLCIGGAGADEWV